MLNARSLSYHTSRTIRYVPLESSEHILGENDEELIAPLSTRINTFVTFYENWLAYASMSSAMDHTHEVKLACNFTVPFIVRTDCSIYISMEAHEMQG